MSNAPSASGPDLTQGIGIDDQPPQAMLLGHVGDEPVLLVRRGERFFAVGATCTHYNGPLAEGIAEDDTVRCPWHHACFSLETGEAVRAPALSPLPCWAVEQRDGKVFVRDRKTAAPAKTLRAPAVPQKIVIVGGGAAAFAAAEQLRREGYPGSLVMLSNDDAPPVDRPNLSKDYLAGNAPEDWMPLRPESFYAEQGIELRLNSNVARVDVASREVVLDDGSRVPYERLLLATGAEPVRLALPGMLHVDTKELARIVKPGHRVTADRNVRSRGAGWEMAFVAVDDHSRVACAELAPDETVVSAITFLQAAVRYYAGRASASAASRPTTLRPSSPESSPRR